MQFLSAVLDLLFPPKCVFCRSLVGKCGSPCNNCKKLPFTTDIVKGEYFDICVSPLRFEGEVRESIHRFKFNGAQQYADTYGRILARRIFEISDNLKYDIISWPPLSRVRLRERGYDQAMLLAQAVAREFDESVTQTLVKTKNAPAQSGISGIDARASNISGAYEAFNPDLFAGKCVLLVDDVVTTGSTLDECAKVLLTAGAAKIVAAAFAIAAS